MSMRYFTLSAVCMLIFCMLLALSGTTDFPGTPDGIVRPPAAPGLNPSGVGEAMASLYPLPETSERHIETGGRGVTQEGVTGSRPLLLLGLVLLGVWVLLSFRLLSKSKN
jgi:hypothetical protein